MQMIAILTIVEAVTETSLILQIIEYPWTHQTYFNGQYFCIFFKKRRFEQNEQFTNNMLKCKNIGILISK